MHLRSALLLVGLATASLAVGLTSAQPADTRRHAVPRVTAPLVFGIYPGGAAGTVGPSGRPRPEVPELRGRSLRRLRGNPERPFVVHLYDSYTRTSDGAAVPPWLASQIADYTADGFQIEL